MNQFNGVLGQIGQAALVALTPLLDRLNEAFANGEFTGIIEWLSNAFTVAAKRVDDVGKWHSVYSKCDPTKLGYYSADPYGACACGSGFGHYPSLQFVAAWLLLNWPILFVIAAIAAVIGILSMMGISGTEILGVIIGTFMLLGEIVRVVIATMWNLFAIIRRVHSQCLQRSNLCNSKIAL